MSNAGRPLRLMDDAGREHQVTVAADDSITVGGVRLAVRRAGDGSLHVTAPGLNTQLWAAESGGTVWVFLDGTTFTFRSAERTAARRRSALHEGALTAPMPATVRQVNVAPGDSVRRADVLIVLEAMKMELPVKAAADGRVASVNCRPGDMVQAGQELIQMEPA